MSILKHNLMVAQERMKLHYDRHHTKREFTVGDWVDLRLQPYRQNSVAIQRNLKLSLIFFGPFQILKKIGVTTR